MSYELSIISKLVGEPNQKIVKKHLIKLFEAGVNSNSLLHYPKEYKWLMEFYRKHGKIPSLTAWKKKYPKARLVKAKDPMPFYIEETIKAQVHEGLVKLNEDVLLLMQQDKPIQALNLTLSNSRTILKQTNTLGDTDLTDGILERIKNYNERRHQQAINGIPCGFSAIDIETTGWQEGEFELLIGRMGSFKTWIMISWAFEAWLSGNDVIFFSKEMNRKALSRRFDTYATATRFKDIKTGSLKLKEWKKFKRAMAKVWSGQSNKLILIGTEEVSDYNTEFIRSKIEEHKPGVAFVDGIYFLETGSKNRADWEKHTEISRNIKNTALTTKTPIVGSTQVGRAAAGKKKQDVELHHISYSDSYAQDADNVIAINRKWDEIRECWSNTIEAEILKIREGETITLPITVDLDKMQFIETAVQVSGDSSGGGVFGAGVSIDLDEEEEAVI